MNTGCPSRVAAGILKVMRRQIGLFDSSITAAIQSWPGWMHSVMVAFSAIGHPVTTIFIIVCIGAAALYYAHAKLVLSAAVAGATIVVNSLLKFITGRARPENDYTSAMLFDTHSFPSGHTSGATVAFGFVAYLAWHFLSPPWALGVTILCTIIIIGVGLSRIYLGAHYPSDVVAGWLLGGLGLLVIIFVLRPFA